MIPSGTDYTIDNLGLVINGRSIEQSGYGQVGYSDIGQSNIYWGTNTYNGGSSIYGMGQGNDLNKDNQYFLGQDNRMNNTVNYVV